ncbi:indolepyruvate ferredoxin oxidoreductase subunit alpha [Streptomyces sp. NPDC057301]|uniref:indolepyruvate ferredoxin oxidoreductase subunit alpha n=1 Tax=Streptomyces sp. NPDC057301 TaxID=3346093 RepID=UPI0036401901
MAYTIGEPCVDVKDGSCVDVCPVDAIYEGRRKLYIHPGECIDCGACAEACPGGAPLAVRGGPPGDPIAEQDAVFFTHPLPGRDGPLGRPGGASAYGPVGVDTETVTAYRA